MSRGTANWFLAIAYLNPQQSNLQEAFHSEESLSLPVMHFITYATRGALFRYSYTSHYAFLTFLSIAAFFPSGRICPITILYAMITVLFHFL